MKLPRINAVSTLLAVSLAINIFMAGMMANQFRPGPPFDRGPGGHPPGPPGMLADMERSLSRDDAAIMRKVMMETAPLHGDDAGSDFRALQKTLTASDFDAAAFQKALQAIHDRHTEMDAAFVRSLTRAVLQISPEGRKKLAEALAHIPPPGPLHHGGPPDDDPGPGTP